MTDETAPSFRVFIAAFTDFLTVAIHTIIYERAIYPQTSFLSARKYNFPVRQNRHPKVCEWINDAVTAVQNELLKASVGRVAVVIYSRQNQPLERFIFDVSRFPVVPTADLDVPLERVNAHGSKENILPMVDMEEEFRATLHRLSNCSSVMTTLPKDCTFTVVIECKGQGSAPIGHPQQWVPTEGRGKQGETDITARNSTTPVRTVTAGEMMFESWIEQIDEKDIISQATGSSG